MEMGPPQLLRIAFRVERFHSIRVDCRILDKDKCRANYLDNSHSICTLMIDGAQYIDNMP
jgi:hypothetical protein